jgi:DNA-directed RNA polymerase specialized sigma subunit
MYSEKIFKKITKNNFNLRIAERIAVVTMLKQTKGQIKLCRDNVDYVTSYIVRGSTTFDETRGTKFFSYLLTKAKYAIKHLISKKQKKSRMRILSLDKTLGLQGGRDICGKDLISDTKSTPELKTLVNEIIEYIKTAPFFLERERRVLLGVFEENMSLADIAKDLDIHRAYAYTLYDNGIEKLRWKFNDE